MTEPSLLPSRAQYLPGEPVLIEIGGPAGALTLRVTHWGEEIAQQTVDSGWAEFTGLSVGGYGVELLDATTVLARTAVEVVVDPRRRLRYGFAVDFAPGQHGDGLARLARRLHLTAIQFYDWAFRHAELLGPETGYTDALGRPVAPDTVAELVAALHQVGCQALGYAAVYGVGNDEWPTWAHDALLDADDTPWGLGDFLKLVDPAAADWSAHLIDGLTRARKRFGFDGFHLDQYGYPKRAHRPDGTEVDVAASFVTLLGAVRAALPTAQLVFNNVNDFPTWRTATAPQNATYIEVWPPHETLPDLVAVVSRARALAPERPVVIAAYQAVYADAPPAVADRTTAFTMATLFSHGATQLLVGGDGRLLIDPYYPRNQPAKACTLDLLARWYDFLVEYGELLVAPDLIEVTGSYCGAYNGDLDVEYDGATVSGSARPGTVWRRVMITAAGTLIVHLINLTDQTDLRWDAPRRSGPGPGPGHLRVRLIDGSARVRVADPDRSPRLHDLPVILDGGDAIVELPEFGVWQLVVIDIGRAVGSPIRA